MLTVPQLQFLAGSAMLLRSQLEQEIVPVPLSPAGILARLALSAEERAVQNDLTAASAHLAQVTALLHRAADHVGLGDGSARI